MFFKRKNKENAVKQKKSIKEKILDKPVKLKSAAGIIIARYIIWTLIVFLLIRGAISILKPSPISTILENQEKFEAKLSKESLLESRAFSFAENFTKEYFNLYFGNAEDYTNRLSKYMDKRIIDTLDKKGNKTA